MRRTEKNLQNSGIIIHHRYPPYILQGINPDNYSYDGSDPNILHMTSTIIDDHIINQLPEQYKIPVNVWNNSINQPRRVKALRHLNLPPLLNDMRLSNEQESSVSLSPALHAPTGAGSKDTNEYLIGKVQVGLILPESTGAGEDWTADKETSVVGEVQAGCQFWIDLDARANLSFSYTIMYGRTDTNAQVSVEPIQLSSFSESIWIGEIMDALGYTEASYSDQVRHYNRDIRDANNTDWAVSVFVVDSENDAGGSFADGAVAYAYLGGPFLVMTYDNGGYGIANMDYVMSHELSHIFWALDEYAASYSAFNNETISSGYLNIINGNFEGTGATDDSCVMRNFAAYSLSQPACTYTLEMLGWRDSDGDNILDIIDTLDLTLDESISLTNKVLQITGTATVLPAYTNTNSWKETFYGDTLNDITILTIADAQYRSDSGNWNSSTPDDGTFNSETETFVMNITLPDSDFPQLSFQAVDSMGNTKSAAITIYPIPIDYTQDSDNTVPVLDGIITISVQGYSFSEDFFILVNSSITFPAPDSNAAKLNPSGVGADITKSITEEALYPLTFTFTYSEANAAGMDESHLVIAYYNSDYSSWVPLEGRVDTAANTVTATVNHFSYFQVMELVPAEKLNTVKSYPNPFNTKNNHTQIVFSNLTAQATIKIYTLLGEPVRTIEENDRDGLAYWDVKNTAGKDVATGTYIYRVSSDSGGDKTGRIIVIR